LRAIAYMRMSFEAEDRLAVVLVNRQRQSTIQRIGIAEKISSPEFIAWLRHQNAQRYEVYLSVNSLRDSAHGRTKADVARIQHIYLDFDKDGDVAVEALKHRADLPEPSFIIHTSPGKRQVIWKVGEFATQEAEDLQRRLARELGADLAATDCARVMRWPGFYNHKYDKPYLVRSEALATLTEIVYRPDDFPSPSARDKELPEKPKEGQSSKQVSSGLSQSEKDWAFAKRALARGESQESVVRAIAEFRRGDKPNPLYYAKHTVQKAALDLGKERGYIIVDEPER